ncbi:aminotransferase class IV [Paenibacillus sp. ACRRX]|uniref:aminotransferase class IV n=1 Tax=Paenibacillus sp. ACRRX TaxID=2918206 RepID=UPI001EF3E448|nr:aminotransferase class IV [Paenibacillus sp. ACRRX]MCG7410746.1 aminotransferase class IV [Paenibacillus sp. ACRRX]
MTIIGWNGKLRSAEEAVIPVWDHGFLYGMTLFETMRTYNGRPYLLEHHLDRLHDACDDLGIILRVQSDEMFIHIRDVMHANGLNEAYIRLTVSAGEQGFGLPTDNYAHPIVMVLTKPLPPLPEELYKTGRPLQLLTTKRNSPESIIRYKSGHYMNNILAKRELMTYPSAKLGAEGLMLNEHGYVTEGIVSNVFAIVDNTLITPAIDTGILPGITRARVIELACAQGLTIKEDRFGWEMLLQAAEVFVTTSVQEIVPVTTLWSDANTEIKIGAGQIGAITQQLLAAYRRETACWLD